jgi:hypothetical protein
MSTVRALFDGPVIAVRIGGPKDRIDLFVPDLCRAACVFARPPIRHAGAEVLAGEIMRAVAEREVRAAMDP